MTEPTPRILRLPDVERLTGLKRDTIYRLAKNPESGFPTPVKLSNTGRASGWVESEVSAFIERRISASRAAAEAGKSV